MDSPTNTSSSNSASVMCTICWSSFGETQQKQFAVTRCGHIFHLSCLSTWMNSHYSTSLAGLYSSCPACRTELILPTLYRDVKSVYLTFEERSPLKDDANEIKSLQAKISKLEKKLLEQNAATLSLQAENRNSEPKMESYKMKFRPSHRNKTTLEAASTTARYGTKTTRNGTYRYRI